jgi:hypothetical protein
MFNPALNDYGKSNDKTLNTAVEQRTNIINATNDHWEANGCEAGKGKQPRWKGMFQRAVKRCDLHLTDACWPGAVNKPVFVNWARVVMRGAEYIEQRLNEITLK